MGNSTIKAAAVFIIGGTVILLYYGLMVMSGDAGPMWAQIGGIAGLLLGIVLLWFGKKQT